ncbi:MAG TPA: cell division protein FtsB [Gammaproteobacteria bacterium]|nr:cell division protein FtsB [Gammaproteobacteria bacterium]
MRLAGRFGWKRLVPLALLLLLALFQFQLWFGVGNVPSAMRLKNQVDVQAVENAALSKRNAALTAEVNDLKGGQAAIEERARAELGMVKKGEAFYQIVQVPAPATRAH